jgi:hypothetical protein
MALNTDFTDKGNEKTATLFINGKSYPLLIKESVAYSISVTGDKFSIEEYTI